MRQALATALQNGETTLPAVVLDLAAFRANARDMAARACGVPIRVASKSLRMREAISTALTFPGYAGVLCYSLREAIWLVREGVTADALVAYPTADTSALQELASDPLLCKAITVTVDSPEHVTLLRRAHQATQAAKQTASSTGQASTPPIRVCLDLDAALVIGGGKAGKGIRIGALRSSIHSPAAAAKIAHIITGTPGLRLVGLLAYEGQIAGEADAGYNPRQFALRALQTLSRKELAKRRPAIVRAVEVAIGEKLEFVNGGGTGSIESTIQENCITELGAGSGLIGSGLFDRYRAFRPQPAEWFVLPVTRRPSSGVATVHGGGRIASGAPGKTRLPTIDYPQGLSFTGTEGAGEVQTPVCGDAANQLQIGDTVWFRHAKAGEALEWANEVLVVDGGKIVARWASYRGEGKVFA